MDTHEEPDVSDVLVVGGGFSGLYAALVARVLSPSAKITLVEARERLGGRAFSLKYGPCEENFFDAGPSWFWPRQNPRVSSLLSMFSLSAFRQYATGLQVFERPDGAILKQKEGSGSPYGRIKGGMLSLVSSLERHLQKHGKVVFLRGTKVIAVKCLGASEGGEGLHTSSCTQVITEKKCKEDKGVCRGVLRSKHVILAMPLRLFVSTIEFAPPLPCSLVEHCKCTPTWMAGMAKAFAFYKQPVWRKNALSGEAYSMKGPLSEIHDASPLFSSKKTEEEEAAQGRRYALFGFLRPRAEERKQMGEDALKHAIARQLETMFPESGTPEDIIIMDWSREAFTATKEDAGFSGSHPRYGLPLGQERALWGGKLVIAGTESAPHYGGFVEGALEAAELAVQEISPYLKEKKNCKKE